MLREAGGPKSSTAALGPCCCGLHPHLYCLHGRGGTLTVHRSRCCTRGTGCVGPRRSQNDKRIGPRRKERQQEQHTAPQGRHGAESDPERTKLQFFGQTVGVETLWRAINANTVRTGSGGMDGWSCVMVKNLFAIHRLHSHYPRIIIGTKPVRRELRGTAASRWSTRRKQEISDSSKGGPTPASLPTAAAAAVRPPAPCCQ